MEKKKIKDLVILNDSYNSNIKGFLSALEILSLSKTRKYIITPGIVENIDKVNNINKQIASKITEICDFCYLINNKNAEIYVKEFKKLNYNQYSMKNSFQEAFLEVKNKEGTLLIENDLTDFYYL